MLQVPKRASKADAMLQLLPSLRGQGGAREGGGGDGGTGEVGRDCPLLGAFVDDDIRELTRPSVMELPLMRILFRRTGL